MELYDENSLQLAIDAGERRLAEARQRHRRTRRRALIGVPLALAALALALTALRARAQVPPAPLLVLTWPKPKIAQPLASGQTVLVRPGQPFSASVTDSERWEITWRAGDVSDQGANFAWSSSEGANQLSASCRPKSSGWTPLFAWSRPSREVQVTSVQAVTPAGANTYARRLTSESGAWVYPNIFARAGDVAWDERALPPLFDAASGASGNLASQLASVQTTPSRAQWRLVLNFEDDPKAKITLNDGTFAQFQGADVENQLPALCSRIVEIAPDASVKFVLRLDKTPPQGTVRLAFDGKRERRAWKRRAGQSAGEPLVEWERNFAPIPLEVGAPDAVAPG